MRAIFPKGNLQLFAPPPYVVPLNPRRKVLSGGEYSSIADIVLNRARCAYTRKGDPR